MIVGFFADIFHVIKFLFGLGALFGLISLGGIVLWLAGHLLVRYALHSQPPEACRWLRKLFLEEERTFDS
jgi:hypothetical protein